MIEGQDEIRKILDKIYVTMIQHGFCYKGG